MAQSACQNNLGGPFLVECILDQVMDYLVLSLTGFIISWQSENQPAAQKFKLVYDSGWSILDEGRAKPPRVANLEKLCKRNQR